MLLGLKIATHIYGISLNWLPSWLWSRWYFPVFRRLYVDFACFYCKKAIIKHIQHLPVISFCGAAFIVDMAAAIKNDLITQDKDQSDRIGESKMLILNLRKGVAFGW